VDAVVVRVGHVGALQGEERERGRGGRGRGRKMEGKGEERRVRGGYTK
jgi:hypothetical protein